MSKLGVVPSTVTLKVAEAGVAEWEGSFSVRNGGTAPERVVLVPAGRGAELILELPPALGSGTVLVVPPDSDWPVSVRLRGAALENGDEAFMAAVWMFSRPCP
ncbi:hypothetical protein FNF27_05291 [Cafeteria roenbergensis]|uniref:Uncharacterized protein n=1 Tax=Cafeteria roenbergensis TaxID=33653 RepID=A0A5A8C882_CAFRO|nr:hypothetical protein FNF29_06309 [Cafeteria roenbergensis]KAA0171034.1 hypothetical protein FNF28_01039 [Cafeteria roenbergensis]KAA0173203.1 hypothetical protein FNF27_05291 [Cafeteria roenbergensis]|eukprot:KAA0149018.1 hypothetical protein FNF29_06309 [Cafeteria roenbergensis]